MSDPERSGSSVCFAPYVSGPRAPYAGTQLLHRHLSRLAVHGPVTLVAPATPANVAAAAELDAAYRVIITPLRSLNPRREVVRYSGLIHRLSSARRPRPDFPPVRQQLSTARRVELQWAECLPLVGQVRRLAPAATVLAFEHDLAFQALERRWAADGPLSAIARRRLRWERSYELGLLDRVDEIAVLKDSDRDELVRAGIERDRVRVMPPSVAQPAEPLPFSEKPIALFVGAMDRPENHVSIMRFISDVWPRVVAEVPSAQLVVAGAAPQAELIDLAGPTVVVTGRVPDLEDWYRQARITIAPLVMGAGLRFKVVQSMAYGRPVVGSTLAFEGLDPPKDAIGCRSDDPAVQAEAVIGLLQDSARAQAAGRAGHRWATAIQDYDRAVDALADGLEGVVHGSSQR